MKKIGITDIALRAGVSAATVSRALNHSPLISPEVRRRILTLARSMGYQPHTRNTRVIAVLFSGLANSAYLLELLSAVQQCAQRRSYRLELILPDALRNLNERLFFGAISFSMPPDFIQTWQDQLSLPLVRVNDTDFPLNNIYSVISNDNAALRQAMTTFRKAGHERIGFLLAGELNHINNIQRLEAYRNQCVIHGLQSFDALTECDFEAVETAFRDLLRQEVTAMVYLVPTSVNLEFLLKKLQIQVPADLSLIVWEMLGLQDNYRPDYTIAMQNFTALANSAIDILEKAVTRKPVESPVHVDYLFHAGNSISPCIKHN